MKELIAELLGTAILIVLGNGVVANVVLAKTKGNSSGWIVITFGWGMAVFVAVMCVGAVSGAHINPAVTLALAVNGDFPWSKVAPFMLAQMIGGFLGGAIVYLFYVQHFKASSDPDLKLACFCTAPNIRAMGTALFCEIIGTIMLVLPIMLMVAPTFALDPNPAGTGKNGFGALGALPVGLLVFAIGLSLGGTTGYAINPARDLGPRLAHAVLPIPGKRDSDWGYAWIPVVGPLIGGVLASLLAQAFRAVK